MFKRILLLAATLVLGAVGVIVLQASETKPATAAPTVRWQPGPHEPWQWMISGTFNVNNPAHMRGGGSDQPTTYDIDGFENTAATVSALHAKGYHVICYIEVGSWVDYRPDSNQFPKSIIGKGIDGFSDKWTDIRSPLLKPIIAARIQMCASKGFDAVEPDLQDGYTNNTGFAADAADQIAFNTWVANTVHAAGMSVLLKGDPEQAKKLAPTVDFFLNEECNDYNECSPYPALAATGKTVLNAEYSVAARHRPSRWQTSTRPCSRWTSPDRASRVRTRRARPVLRYRRRRYRPSRRHRQRPRRQRPRCHQRRFRRRPPGGAVAALRALRVASRSPGSCESLDLSRSRSGSKSRDVRSCRMFRDLLGHNSD